MEYTRVYKTSTLSKAILGLAMAGIAWFLCNIAIGTMIFLVVFSIKGFLIETPPVLKKMFFLRISYMKNRISICVTGGSLWIPALLCVGVLKVLGILMISRSLSSFFNKKSEEEEEEL